MHGPFRKKGRTSKKSRSIIPSRSNFLEFQVELLKRKIHDTKTLIQNFLVTEWDLGFLTEGNNN